MLEAISYASRSIGRDLLNMRAAAGLSKAEVARKVRIRPEMLGRIEKGQGNPTVATVRQIVRAIEALS